MREPYVCFTGVSVETDLITFACVVGAVLRCAGGQNYTESRTGAIVLFPSRNVCACVAVCMFECACSVCRHMTYYQTQTTFFGVWPIASVEWIVKLHQ